MFRDLLIFAQLQHQVNSTTDSARITTVLHQPECFIYVAVSMAPLHLPDIKDDRGKWIPNSHENPVGMGTRLQFGNGKECKNLRWEREWEKIFPWLFIVVDLHLGMSTPVVWHDIAV